MKFNYLISICTFLFGLLFGACDADDPTQPLQEQIEGQRILVYMVADNNLDYFAMRNINEMEEGLFYTENPQGEIWVYIDRSEQGTPAHPYLMKLTADTTNRVVSDIVITYPEQNSANPKVLKKVLDDVRQLSGKHFKKEGLILWSHGNAWLPRGVGLYSDRDKIITRSSVSSNLMLTDRTQASFGADNVSITGKSTAYPEEMDIRELAKVLANEHFEFILFDACFMGSIEVIYELKDAAKHIIASPTEILSWGFPYKNIVPILLSKKFSPTKVAKEKQLFYQKLKGALKSSSVTVVDTHKLPILAKFIKTDIVKKIGTINILDEEKSYSKENLQQFDRLGADYLFDMKSFIDKVYTDSQDKKSQQHFSSIWKQVVVYESHTPYFMGTLSLKECEGLSMYILQNYPKRKATNAYYKTLKWYKDAGL